MSHLDSGKGQQFCHHHPNAMYITSFIFKEDRFILVGDSTFLLSYLKDGPSKSLIY